MPATHAPDGNQLKDSALAKLEQARSLISSAREDICNLEGNGYCAQYEALNPLCEKVGYVTAKLRNLKPPTGVFRL
jgi:hypothetical protein